MAGNVQDLARQAMEFKIFLLKKRKLIGKNEPAAMKWAKLAKLCICKLELSAHQVSDIKMEVTGVNDLDANQLHNASGELRKLAADRAQVLEARDQNLAPKKFAKAVSELRGVADYMCPKNANHRRTKLSLLEQMAVREATPCENQGAKGKYGRFGGPDHKR